MPWQDAPLLQDPQQPPQPQQPGWRAAPLAVPGGQAAQTPTPSPLATSAPVSPQAPGGQTQGGADLGSTAFWNKPADASWSDYLLAHLARQTQGGNQAASDYARAISDTTTFGLADRLQSALTGNSLDQERALTQQAHQRLGPMDYAASAIGYAPLGELGGAARAADAARYLTGGSKLAGWAGGVLGAGAEGASASALGTLGHGGSLSDAATAAELGGGLGALTTGVLGAGTARTLPAAPSTADLLATAKQGYRDAGNILYNNADIRQAMMNARTEIGQQPQRVTRLGQGALDQIGDIEGQALGKGAMSAEDLNDYVKSLHNYQTGDQVPDAGQIAQKHLNLILGQAQPISGQARGAGGEAIANANQAFGRFSDVDRLQDWQTKAARAGQPDIGSQASSWLGTEEGMRLAPSGSPQLDALNALAATARPPQVSAAPGAWDIRHVVQHLVPAATGAAFGGYQAGPQHDVEGALGGMATGALLGYGLHKGVPWVQGMAQRAAQQQALDAARVTLATGQKTAPLAGPSPYGDALRNLIFGLGARGVY
jgi:hypothetical protein